MIHIAYAEETPGSKRPPMGPSGAELTERDWAIFSEKMKSLVDRGMYLAIGRALVAACYDENETRKKTEARGSASEARIFSNAARIFYNAIKNSSDLSKDSDFLQTWQSRKLNQSLNSILNSPALRTKPVGNSYHMAAYLVDRDYRTTASDGKTEEYKGVSGLGRLAFDALTGSENYQQFESNLRERFFNIS